LVVVPRPHTIHECDAADLAGREHLGEEHREVPDAAAEVDYLDFAAATIIAVLALRLDPCLHLGDDGCDLVELFEDAPWIQWWWLVVGELVCVSAFQEHTACSGEVMGDSLAINMIAARVMGPTRKEGSNVGLWMHRAELGPCSRTALHHPDPQTLVKPLPPLEQNAMGVVKHVWEGAIASEGMKLRPQPCSECGGRLRWCGGLLWV
jgi:hypothetical protein